MAEKRPRALVLMNETHRIYPHQHRALLEQFATYEKVPIPFHGWTSEEMLKKCEELLAQPTDIVFLSPLPLMIGALVAEAMRRQMAKAFGQFDVLIFQRDCRKELPTHDSSGNQWRLFNVTAG